jgi:transposase-like protein
MVKKENTGGVAPKAKRARIPPEVRAEALRLARSGVSNLEIANRLGIAEGSVRYMRKKAEASTRVEDAFAVPELQSPEPAAESSDASVDAAIDGLELGGDLRVLVRGLIGEAMKTAKMAADDRNSSAAAKALRDAIGALPGLIRLEKASAENVDAVSIPREIIDREIEAIYGRARTLASVELCPRCGCQLRMAAVGAAKDQT